ncbi:MAG: hypothetical protein WC536_03920 [Patescibacteria group bacterium]
MTLKIVLDDVIEQAISALKAYCKFKGWKISDEEIALIRMSWLAGDDIQIESSSGVELEVISPRISGDNVILVYQDGERKHRATKNINNLIYQATNNDWYDCEMDRLAGKRWLAGIKSK